MNCPHVLVKVTSAKKDLGADVTLKGLDVPQPVNGRQVVLQAKPGRPLPAANFTCDLRVRSLGALPPRWIVDVARGVRCVVVSTHRQLTAKRHQTQLTRDTLRPHRLKAQQFERTITSNVPV